MVIEIIITVKELMNIVKDIRIIILYAVPISLSGLRWAKKTGIFILGTLTLMTVGFSTLFL